MINVLQYTLDWFRASTPTPVSKHIHTQFGCHFEEIVEMIDEIDGIDLETEHKLRVAADAVHALAEHLKAKDGVIVIRHTKRKAMIDAIADQLVTGTGCAHVLSMDPVGALQEVNRSNWSKFDDEGRPIRDPVTHKIMKGPNYSPADLTPYC